MISKKDNLITVIGGKINYGKNVKNLFSNGKRNFKEPLVFYILKLTKYDYDQYILLSNNSIIKYLLPEDILIDSNLDIWKIVDLKIYIKYK